jgi:hypothetical protein
VEQRYSRDQAERALKQNNDDLNLAITSLVTTQPIPDSKAYVGRMNRGAYMYDIVAHYVFECKKVDLHPYTKSSLLYKTIMIMHKKWVAYLWFPPLMCTKNWRIFNCMVFGWFWYLLEMPFILTGLTSIWFIWLACFPCCLLCAGTDFSAAFSTPFI